MRVTPLRKYEYVVTMTSRSQWHRLYAAYVDGVVQDCNISSALALEILKSCPKPSCNQRKIITMCVLRIKRTLMELKNYIPIFIGYAS